MEPIYLVINQPVNESQDGRLLGKAGNMATRDYGPGIINAYDWRVWSASGFGNRLRGLLNSGSGRSFEVSDMGAYVVVRATYHNTATGEGKTKTFVISFDNPKIGDGKIFSTSTKWRTFSTVGQAASYINSAITS